MVIPVCIALACLLSFIFFFLSFFLLYFIVIYTTAYSAYRPVYECRRGMHHLDRSNVLSLSVLRVVLIAANEAVQNVSVAHVVFKELFIDYDVQ